MDRVRFGRALGVGVREAAKAAVKAAEAAAAPDPAGGTKSAASPGTPKERVRVEDVVRQTAKSAAGLREGGRRFGQSALAPVKKAGGVLWHEVMGVLFGLFVLVAAEEAWRGRGALLREPGRTHEWLALAMLLVFGFFMISSFVKARRRGQR
jgi:hypothetical protein